MTPIAHLREVIINAEGLPQSVSPFLCLKMRNGRILSDDSHSPMTLVDVGFEVDEETLTAVIIIFWAHVVFVSTCSIRFQS